MNQPVVPVDLSHVELIDLSHPWGVDTPAFVGYDGPVVKWIKRPAFDRVGGQKIETTLHVGTHLDAPIHFITGGKDIASLPLDRLFGPGVVVDISDEVGDYDIYTPEHIIRKVEVRKGDILIIHTGYHHYYNHGDRPDEERYFCKHPGPTREFAEWALSMELRWIGIDAGSADHPMNTIIRKLRPDLAREAERKLGRPLDEIFPDREFQLMHNFLFPHDLVHVENVGGDIDRVLNQRVWIGCFPWKFEGGEAAFCRVVAFVQKHGA
ncbi:cyclase family protein [Thermaerobacter sp. PB12/4term]|uniref:cyclase family protein n=1 Tax=Thermaerobacter sp. PB12/4term TaxID=2293838 RepID=UPI000E325BD8|nr:cyclase family protein [Thermaerobacter sp. PB12/4term]QIA27379.1 cyclase family protein [Thermaerobacter sp. PB12/4term]